MSAVPLGSELPIASAPMAGGVTTPRLAAAVMRAGAFAFLAGGYRAAPDLAEQISATRAHGECFGVNLFVPSADPVDAGAFARYARALADEARAHGVALDSVPRTDDDAWHEKLALLADDPVPLVSFTFGLPDAQHIRAIRRAGTIVLVTVTTPDEARAAEDAGSDGLIVQGPLAGGHSACWDAARTIEDEATVRVLRRVLAVTKLPLLAAGGVDGSGAAGELLAAGARGVVIGTLLLRSDESGASATHRGALASPEFSSTAITRAFTGRPARALRNGFMRRHDNEAITAYPAVHHLTRELRGRAAAAGDADRLHLWAGTGYRAASSAPATEIIARLAAGL